MFYYLLYNSSFSFIVDNRLFSTVLYGSILYILTHAILNNCRVEILEIINNYFWFILTLDIVALCYGVYQYSMQLGSGSGFGSGSSNEWVENGNLDVSFNLLRNQINTISSFFNKKNDITIADSTPVPTPRQPLRISVPSGGNQSASQYSQLSQLQSQLQSQQPIKNKNSRELDASRGTGFSTPITALRNLDLNTDHPPPSRNTMVSQIPEPIVSGEYDFNDNGITESIADSDVGSIMDLDDFEKSL
jgi:hypothetical protein